MVPALIALIGVVVGGLLNGGVTFYLERRRERANLRAALRSLLHEMQQNKGISGVCTKLWSSPGGASDDSVIAIIDRLKRVSCADWEENRRVVAHALPTNEQWDTLSRAARAGAYIRDLGERSDVTLGLDSSNMTEVHSCEYDLAAGVALVQRLLGLAPQSTDGSPLVGP